jgi:hypothetical protein
LNDIGRGKGNQQRTKVFMVMIIINNKHEKGYLLSVSFLSGVALTLSIGIRFYVVATTGGLQICEYITTFRRGSKVLICWEVVEKFIFEYPSMALNLNFSNRHF